MKRLLINSIVMLTIWNAFIKNEKVELLIGLIILLSMLYAFKDAKKQNRAMFVVIILAIQFIQPVSIEGISEFITSFSSNSGILSLFIVIPLLGKPITSRRLFECPKSRI